MNARDAALAIARDALASLDVAARVREAVGELREPVVLAAVGKAAPAMARAALDALDVRRAVVVAPDGTDSLGLEVMRAAHPVPDGRSVAAARALLDVAHDAPLLLALISGGASALACAPVPGVSLAEKQAVIRALLASGAPITDINCVRRHLSQIKGGGLAARARRTHAIVVSDVLFGDVSDIGSGPATPAPLDLERARVVLARYAPELAHLAESMVESPSVHATSRIVARPEDLAEAAARVARARGYTVTVLPPSLAPADDLAAEYAATRLGAGEACVRVAEPAVVLPALHGRGGRAGRVALRAWHSGLGADVALACLASDGVDGTSGAAGAVVSGRVDATHALATFDDAPFLLARGAAIEGAPTGNNLTDLHVLLRAG